MKAIAWEDVKRLPSGNIVKAVSKFQEGEAPTQYYFVVLQEPAVPQYFTAAMLEGRLRFYPQTIESAALKKYEQVQDNMVGFVYSQDGKYVAISRVKLSEMRYFVFEPEDMAELLSVAMRLLTYYDLLKEEVDTIRAKAAKPFFGCEAF